MTHKHYAERDIIEQDEHYVAHVNAMTVEDLHSKSAIAAELAHRDIVIEALHKELAEAQKCVAFFASVIKSGESWTDECEKAKNAALSQGGRSPGKLDAKPGRGL